MVTYQPATLPEEPFSEGPHDVGFYVSLALERNPEVLAAQRAVAAQAQVIPQVTSLSDPVITDTFMPVTSNSLQTAAGRAPNTLTLSQKFPWLSKLRVRGEIAEQDAKIALTRLAQSQLKVTEDVHLAYFEVAFLQRAIEVTEQDGELLQDLLQFADARYRTGAASYQDVLRAQVELDRLADRLIQLNRQLEQAQADLAATIHTNPDADLQATTQTPIPNVPGEIKQLYEAAVRCRPELQERLHAMVKSQRATELAELEYYPDFNLGFGWQTVTTDNALAGVANGHDNLAVTIGVELPIWRDRLRAGVHEAEHRTVESSLKYDSARDDTFRIIRRLTIQTQTLDEQIRLFQNNIIPRAEQALRVSAADYRVGKVDFQQIIDNWTDLLTFQIQLARLEANLAQSLASLERTIGCQLATIPHTVEGGPVLVPNDSTDSEDADPPVDPDIPPAPPAELPDGRLGNDISRLTGNSVVSVNQELGSALLQQRSAPNSLDRPPRALPFRVRHAGSPSMTLPEQTPDQPAASTERLLPISFDDRKEQEEAESQ